FFRLSNGVDVQALWSQADFFPGVDAPGQGTWAVYDGTNQKFFLDGTPGWSNASGGPAFNLQYALTMQRDQTGDVDDNITIGTGANGGVQITENGETVNFDPNQITTITINALSGSNTIKVNPLPAGVKAFADSVGGTNKFTALNTSNIWKLTGPDNGTPNGLAFSNATALIGGSSADTFTFLPGGSISGNLDGGGGDTLDYSNLAGPATVDFTTATATGIGGTFSGITNVIGSASAG